MENARPEPSAQSCSIHLVSKEGLNTAVPADAPTNQFQPLYLRLPQLRSIFTANSATADHTSTENPQPSALSLVTPATVLRELFELLEDYSPVWYTEENHNRAVAALNLAKR